MALPADAEIHDLGVRQPFLEKFREGLVEIDLQPLDKRVAENGNAVGFLLRRRPLDVAEPEGVEREAPRVLDGPRAAHARAQTEPSPVVVDLDGRLRRARQHPADALGHEERREGGETRQEKVLGRPFHCTPAEKRRRMIRSSFLI